MKYPGYMQCYSLEHVFVAEQLNNLRSGAGNPRGRPALPLIAVLPACHAASVLSDLAVERLDAVRCFETRPQFGKNAQPVKRQRFLQTFIQTGHRRNIQPFEFLRWPVW